MKFSTKLLFACLIAVASLSAQGQGYPPPQLVTQGPLLTVRTPVLDATKDTTVNGGVTNLQIMISGFENVVSLQSNITPISGTCGGVVRLLASNDGVKFTRVCSIIQKTGLIGLDSLLVGTTAVNQVHIFGLDKHLYKYYQLQYTGASTMAAAQSGYAIWRRQP